MNTNSSSKQGTPVRPRNKSLPSFQGEGRGVRLCNPLNIRRTRDRWKGMRTPQTDRSFVQFENFYYGYRAAVPILGKYRRRGWNTLAKIILHWAPPSENDTERYISFVEQQSGVPRDDILPSISEAPVTWRRILEAMTRIEGGSINQEMRAALDRVIHDYPDL